MFPAVSQLQCVCVCVCVCEGVWDVKHPTDPLLTCLNMRNEVGLSECVCCCLALGTCFIAARGRKEREVTLCCWWCLCVTLLIVKYITPCSFSVLLGDSNLQGIESYGGNETR